MDEGVLTCGNGLAGGLGCERARSSRLVELEGGLLACAAFPLEPFEGLRSPTACDLLKRQHTGQAGCSAIDAQTARTDTDAVTKRWVLKRR